MSEKENGQKMIKVQDLIKVQYPIKKSKRVCTKRHLANYARLGYLGWMSF